MKTANIIAIVLCSFLSLPSGESGWTLGGAVCFSQCDSTPSPSLSFVNPSFEGPSCAGCQPGPWVNCGGTPDTQPGSWGFTQPASDGNSYVSFLQSGSSAGGYYEGSSQALSACMTAGQVYSFSIDLAHSNIYNTAGPGDCYSSLRILGSNGLCAASEVLWESGLITSTSWQTYTVTLTPTSNWCFVTFRPYWISACNGYVNISVDNLGPMETNAPAVNATVSAGISCNQNITGTTSCPADSIVLTGLFNGASINAVMPTDTTWNSNVTYQLGSATAQKITVQAYMSTGVILYDTITFNLVDITPDFVAPGVCVGNSTTFTDNTTVSSGNITGWTWSFGDGSPVNTTQNPSHTYANPGTYSVSLMVNSSLGCQDTVTKLVQVYYKPTAGFTNNNVCFGDSISFTNSSSVDPSSSITGNLWSFGDTSPTSNLQNPAHYYSGAGTYTVILITTTIDGCSDTASAPVEALDSPLSVFSFSNTCLFDSAKFTNTSLNPIIGTITGWVWDFGDGSPANTAVWSPNHLYTTPGNYQLTLITYSSSQGCADTLQDSITVFPLPVADFSFADVCLNQSMAFTDLSVVSTGNISGRSWNFGDGSPLSTLPNPDHTYASAGTYTVSLITTSNSNCKDTITKNVVVHSLPVANFSSVSACEGSSVQFNDLSSIPGTDSIQSWVWAFGDGNSFSTSQNTSHLYPSEGFYVVQLLVVSDFGCSDSITKLSFVNPKPIISFTANDTAGCEPLCVNFQNLSSIATGSNTQWLWDFGDSSPAGISENPEHCYSNSSVAAAMYFTVTLTVTSDSGCVSTLSKNNYIAVYPNPVADFTAQPPVTTITDPVISFSDLSVGTDTWNWDFGDGSVPFIYGPATPSISHTYADTGIFLITLIASTQYNCKDTVSQTIIIESDFLFYIPNAFTPGGDGLNETFSGKGLFIKTYEMTIFDRWGNSVFYTDDINTPWDGKANRGNEIAQADVYVYVIAVTDYNRRKHNYKGIVTLVR